MTDGHYPDGDPYGRGVADEVYGTGAKAAYPAYDSYDTGANSAYGATAYDSGAWQTGGYDTSAYTQSAYSAAQPGYDTGAYEAAAPASPYVADTPSYGTTAYDASAYGTPAYGTTAYDGTGSGYDAAGSGSGSGAYEAVATYDSSGSYAAVDNSGGYPAYDSGAYPAATSAGTSYETAYDTSYDASYNQTAVIPQQTGYDSGAWPVDTANAWSSAPAADMWAGDNRLGADAFTDPQRNDGGASGWYDASTQVQEPVPAYDGYAAAWDDAEPWHNGNASGAPAQAFSGGFETPAAFDTATAFDTPAGFEATDGYDATQEFAAATVTLDPDADGFAAEAYGTAGGFDTDKYPADEYAADEYGDDYSDDYDDGEYEHDGAAEGESDAHVAAAAAVAGLSASAAGSRAARRKTTKRTRPMARVAGASLGVLGATAMAVAAAGGIQAADKQGTVADDTVASGPDVPLASPLDQQFTDLRDSAADFADRASRAQARVALQERQEEIARQQEEERKKREQLRPKYVLPVAPGLSAYFGQAGGRWSNLHTGIDFPVDRGTPVRAVTDGVVRTEWNRSYGNMVILTAADGTETWYCHLTRAKVNSGPVKAGDVIAYSGNSGNSTGPHLHLEVRPNGGAPINPIPWLRARGLDPTG
ncbi:peptidoglycan DD-metalloendopeptidase family protein [Streptomycetaceae bacterium NBC_01309]